MKSAMIIAGGMGTRMAQSGVLVPKAIVPVAGMPMLERNFRQLVRHGFDRIVVAVSQANMQVVDFANTHLRALAAELNVSLETSIETTPLGNIGPVQAEAERGEDLMVVYADNLTALDLTAVYESHCSSSAAMTLAVHEQPFRMPFGEVQTDGVRITGYFEKPTHAFLVCSAINMLSPEAIRSIAPGECLGISNLASRMIEKGAYVRAFRHQALWIDVNESSDVATAEQMIRENPEAFGEPVTGVA